MVSYETFKDFFNNIKDGFEPEMRIIFRDRNREYMIIRYNDYITFQRCGFQDGSEEIRFCNLDELYNTRTIDDILLKEEWGRIEDIVVDEIYSVVLDWEELKKSFCL